MIMPSVFHSSFTYAVIMITAIGTAILLRCKPERRLPLTRTQQCAIGLGAFCGAMIGAKLPFVLTDWEALRTGAAWFDNGKTILAGLVGGYLGVELAKELTGVTIKTGDSFAVPVAAAVAVGRLACFVGGCCYGKPTSLPWGVIFHDGVARHPTQLYESAFHALAAVFLTWTERCGLFRNQRIKLYLITYVVYRFCTEFLRPEPILALRLTGYQIASLVLLLLLVWLWHRDAAALQARDPQGTVPGRSG